MALSDENRLSRVPALSEAHLRVARPTDHVAELIEFYVGGLGFEVLSSFEDHAGFDGIMLGHRGSQYHLEFTSQKNHEVGKAPSQENLLVFYLENEVEWRAAVERMQDHGYAPVQSHNPYWDERGQDIRGRRWLSCCLAASGLVRAGILVRSSTRTMKTVITLRTPVTAFRWFLFVLLVSGLACIPVSSRRKPVPRPSPAPSPNERQKSTQEMPTLAERLKTLCQPAGGTVGIAVIHVETGRSVNVNGDQQLPLYSVFKLPLAVTLLKDVEEGHVQLDTKVPVSPADIVPGSRENTDRWRIPVERTIKELLKFSIAQSDNTASDKLLKLVGGPKAVTRRLRDLGFGNIYIQSTIREYVSNPDYVNTGSAADLAKLLAQLHNGQILKQPELDLVMQFMRQATTGQRRLRGALPAGTQVADKTGSGIDGVATNDVGIITLPEGKGHLAIAVLVSGSKLPAEAQEDLIASVAKMVYDDYLLTP